MNNLKRSYDWIRLDWQNRDDVFIVCRRRRRRRCVSRLVVVVALRCEWIETLRWRVQSYSLILVCLVQKPISLSSGWFYRECASGVHQSARLHRRWTTTTTHNTQLWPMEIFGKHKKTLKKIKITKTTNKSNFDRPVHRAPWWCSPAATHRPVHWK